MNRTTHLHHVQRLRKNGTSSISPVHMHVMLRGNFILLTLKLVFTCSRNTPGMETVSFYKRRSTRRMETNTDIQVSYVHRNISGSNLHVRLLGGCTKNKWKIKQKEIACGINILFMHATTLRL